MTLSNVPETERAALQVLIDSLSVEPGAAIAAPKTGPHFTSPVAGGTVAPDSAVEVTWDPKGRVCDLDVFRERPSDTVFENGDLFSIPSSELDEGMHVLSAGLLPDDGSVFLRLGWQDEHGNWFYAEPEELLESKRYEVIEVQLRRVQPKVSMPGIDLYAKYREYKAPSLTRTPDRVFDTLPELQDAISAKKDHGGAVYQLRGGKHKTTKGLRISDCSNLTVWSDPSDPAVIDGEGKAGFGIHVFETKNGSTRNIDVIGFWTRRTLYHGIFIGGAAPSVSAGGAIQVLGCSVTLAAMRAGAGIVVRNGKTSLPITIEANHVWDIAPGNESSGVGEGIYVGSGNHRDMWAKNVIIRGNRLHGIFGEAIDVKRASHQIMIEYNLIYDVKLASQGGITLLLGDKTPQEFDAGVIVRRNMILGVKTLHYDGDGIVAAAGGIDVSENIIVGCAGFGVTVYNDCDGRFKTVHVDGNLLLLNKKGGVAKNIHSGNRSPNDPCEIPEGSNFVDSRPEPRDVLVDVASFGGPLEGDFDAGSGPGSALALV